MKRLILIIVIASAACVGFLLYRHPIILKAVAGSARVLSPPLNATIKINGVIQPTAKCFAMKSLYDGSPIDNLVLWLKGASISYEVLIIDKPDREVGSPNSGDMNYDFLLNKFLFQSESGARFASFRSEKSYAQDPKLEIRGSYIKFVVPQSSFQEEKVVEVIFN